MEDVRVLLQLFVRRFGILHADCCGICCGQELSLTQSHILFEIKRQNNSSMQQVADALDMDLTTFSRQIKTLENKGLVIRTPDLDDRRVNLLSLTFDGKNIENQINIAMTQYIEKVFSQFTELEKSMIIGSIKLVNEALIKTGPCC